jgi:viroplasmin and RNaseH domain-containing protein
VYTSCESADAQVRGFRGAEMKRFGSEAAARSYIAAAAAQQPPRGRHCQFPYYAVRVGRRPGIYRTNEEAQAQVSGVSCNQYKGFHRYDEAERYIQGGRAAVGAGARSRSRGRSCSRGRSRSRSRERSSGEREAIRHYYGRF